MAVITSYTPVGGLAADLDDMAEDDALFTVFRAAAIGGASLGAALLASPALPMTLPSGVPPGKAILKR